MNLFATCARALVSDNAQEKLELIAALHEAAESRTLTFDFDAALEPIGNPGYPVGLRLVPPQRAPKRNVASPIGRTKLIHAIAHIEFNAMHLALDACYRFRSLPRAYYDDWLRVAAEEAKHFGLLRASLERRGSGYGHYAAHNGLWDMAVATANSVLARMALVPLVLEARGLDVTPGLRDRFAQAGDDDAVAILDVILRDEIGHVMVGNRWFRQLCAQQGVDPGPTFVALTRQHRAPRPHLPLNREARLQAGFTEQELDIIALAWPDGARAE